MAANPVFRAALGGGTGTSGGGEFGGPATFADMIVSRIRDALFDHKLVPGDFLGSEKDLAADFGVSRNTARDALRTLEALGIVDIKVGAGGGARIAAGNLDKFSESLAIQFNLVGVSEGEILDAQWALEGMTAELAAAHATQSDLAAMESLLDAAALVVDDPAATAESGMQFHLAIAEASHNRALISQLTAMRHVVWPKGSRMADREKALRIVALHRQLFEYIKSGDGSAARELMHDHLASIRRHRSDQTKQALAGDYCC